MKNSLKNATIDHHYFEKQNAIHLGEVLSVGFHIKQRNLPHSPEHGRLSMSTLKRQLIPFLYFLLPDEVSTLVAVLHQRHCSDQFASPIDIILFEAAHVQDEIGWHPHLLAHKADVCPCLVLARRCPPLNDGAHGVSLVLHSIRPQQSQIMGSVLLIILSISEQLQMKRLLVLIIVELRHQRKEQILIFHSVWFSRDFEP